MASMEQRLAKFSRPDFSVDAWVGEKLATTSDKGLRALASDLAELRSGCADELRRSVYSDAGSFVLAASELAGLQHGLARARSLLGALGAVVGALRDAADDEAAAARPGAFADPWPDADQPPAPVSASAPPLGDAAEALDVAAEAVEVAVAEGRLSEAATALLPAALRLLARSAQRDAGAAAAPPPPLPDGTVERITSRLAAARAELGDALADVAGGSASPPSARRAAAAALSRLGDGGRAVELLLALHAARAEARLGGLRPPASGDADPTAAALFAASVSSAVVSAAAHAADDVAASFGRAPGAASALVAWADAMVGRWADALCAHGAPLAPPHLAPPAATSTLRQPRRQPQPHQQQQQPGQLAGACAAARVALAHTRLAEPFGLCLSPALAARLREPFSALVGAAMEAGGLPAPLAPRCAAYLRGGSSAQLDDLAAALMESGAAARAG